MSKFSLVDYSSDASLLAICCERRLGDQSCLNDKMPTYMQLYEFLKSEVRARENLEASAKPKKQTEGQRTEGSRNKYLHKPKAAYSTIQFKAKSKQNGPLCQDEHYMLFYSTFKAVTVEDRLNIVEKFRLC